MPQFRFYEGRSEGPQRPERDGPALMQGGGEALMFGDSRGPGPMNETMHQQNDKASKLGSATIAVHQKRSSARRSRLRIGGSGPARSACPNNLAS